MTDGNASGEPAQPATETRGGEKPDWAKAKPGQALPEREDQKPEPASQPGRE